MINSPTPVSMADIVTSRQEWVETQKKEQVRTRKVDPALLNINS